MFKQAACSLLALYIQSASAFGQQAPVYSDFEFRKSCELLFDAAAQQANRLLVSFFEVEEPIFSDSITHEIERIGSIRNFDQQEIIGDNLELRLLLPTRTISGSRFFIFRSSSYEVPVLNTEIEYLFCRAKPVTKAIFQIGVRMRHRDDDADTFYISPEMMSEVSDIAASINRPRR